jgi:hypothetical protein
MRYCSPALLYLIISTFSILLASSMNVLPIFILTKVAFTLLWAWFLNFLCVKGYKRVSWILVLVPYMIIIMNIFILLTDDVCLEEGFVEGKSKFKIKGLSKKNVTKYINKKVNKAKKEAEKAKKEAEKAKKEAKKAKKEAEKAKKEADNAIDETSDNAIDETSDNAISATY